MLPFQSLIHIDKTGARPVYRQITVDYNGLRVGFASLNDTEQDGIVAILKKLV